LATFPGGEEAMIQYINEHIRYPQEAVNNLLEDKIYARTCITETGKIGNVEIVKGKYEILNQEAYRVISQMPDWNPARSKGKKTCCSYTIPVNFKIDRITKRKIRRQTRK
jgi:TonB family protein